MIRAAACLVLIAIVAAVPVLLGAPVIQIASLGALIATTAAIGWGLRFARLSPVQANLLFAAGIGLNLAAGAAMHAAFAGWILLVVANGVIFLSQLRAGARRDGPAVAAFMLFLPRTLAGPVVGYRSFARRLRKGLARPWDPALAEAGAIQLAVGLGKWLVLAREFERMIAPVFAAAEAGARVGGTDAWLAAIANYLQLYFQLSGACDVAIGLLLLAGIRLPPAFQAPLRAVSVASFWRRYHRTLVAFTKVYLYRTLRVGGRVPSRVAGLAAFVVAGLWFAPGLPGLAWGGLQAAAMLVGRPSWPRPVGWLATQLFMALTALLLHVSSLGAVQRLLEGLIGHAGFALPAAALNFFPPAWRKHLVFTDQPLIANHTLGLIVVLLLLAISAVALAVPSLDKASRTWRRAYFAVVIYFVLGLAVQLDAIPVSFAGIRL
jgi:hypothetical protein